MPLASKDLPGGSAKRKKSTALPTDPDTPKGKRNAYNFFMATERVKHKGSSDCYFVTRPRWPLPKNATTAHCIVKAAQLLAAVWVQVLGLEGSAIFSPMRVEGTAGLNTRLALGQPVNAPDPAPAPPGTPRPGVHTDISFTEQSAAVGKAWKALEDRKPFVRLAEEDKARYAREMDEYTPPPSFYLTKGKKLPTDPDKPKRAGGAFDFFTAAKRVELKGTSPSSDLP